MRKKHSRNVLKAFVTITLLVTVIFSYYTVIPSITNKLASYLTPEVEVPTAEASPTTDFFDFHNGTTLSIISYPNGSRDEIAQTLITETEFRLGDGTAIKSLQTPLSKATSQRASSPADKSLMMNLQPGSPPAPLVLLQDVVMGFTFGLEASRWDAVPETTKTITYPTITFPYFVIKTFKASLWVEVNLAFGLRLPVNITLEYPEHMFFGTDYPFNATLTPLDWTAAQYGAAGLKDILGRAISADENELLFQFTVSSNLLVEEWIDNGWDTLINKTVGPDFDENRSFTTPVGPGMPFPDIPTTWEDIITLRYPPLIGFPICTLQMRIIDELASEKITALVTTEDDATGAYLLEWTEPSTAQFDITAESDNNSWTNSATITLSDFRYYFSAFNVTLELQVIFEDLLDFLPNLVFPVWNYDHMERTGEYFTSSHLGTDGTMDVEVDVFAPAPTFDVELTITPPTQDILPGATATYTIDIENLGSVEDTFELSLTGLPDSWVEFSSTAITIPTGETVPVTLSITPAGTAVPGTTYPFTVTGTSQQAPGYGQEATDMVTAEVVILEPPITPPPPTYDVDLTITPPTQPIDPGDTGTYIIQIDNLGGVEDTFELSLGGIPGLPGSWTTAFSSTEVTISAGGTTNVQLFITPEVGAVPDNYSFTVTGTSLQEPAATDTVTAEVVIPESTPAPTPTFDVYLTITPPTRSVEPGATATYTIDIHNLGSDTDTFALSLADLPVSWTTTVTPSPPIPAAGIDQVTLSITPDGTTMPGTYHFTVTGTSQQAPGYGQEATDSVEAIVNVIPITTVIPTEAPLFSDVLLILPVAVLLGTLIVLRRRKRHSPEN